MNDILLTFYGDDFTGSTDTMEALTLNGVPTVLFLDPPTPEQLERFEGLRGIGVAGVSRSMTPAQMDGELPPKFEALKTFNAPVFHYKVCSTFDSSPDIGSIGHTIDIGCRIFDPPVVPLSVGAPSLRRYVVFGNLYATVGNTTFRLDRHPTMSKHPITPMNESDLRLHLGKQTNRRIGLIDLLQLAQPDDVIDAQFELQVKNGAEVVLFDTIDETHLLKIGRLMWSQAGDKPVFIVGSSGVEYALAAYWQSIGLVEKPPLPESPGKVDQLLVVSGSAAPPTAEQIDWAAGQGFKTVQLNSPRLVDPDTADAERVATIANALEILGNGHSLILYSAHGPDDPAIAATNNRLSELGLDPKSVGHRLGAQQGMILRELLEKTGLERACVAGGDTCGHTSRQLGIFALEVVIPVAPGAPLCRASSNNPQFDGLQISLKGGQNGKADYFVKILNGELG